MVETGIANETVSVALRNSSFTVPSGVWILQIQSHNDDEYRQGPRINGTEVATLYYSTTQIPQYNIFSTVVSGGDVITSPDSELYMSISGYRVDSGGYTITNDYVSVQLSGSSITVPTNERWNVNVQATTKTDNREHLRINGNNIYQLFDNEAIPQSVNLDLVLDSGDTFTLQGGIKAHIGGFKV